MNLGRTGEFPDNMPDYRLQGVDTFMTEDEALKLAESLTIVTAACCIIGVSPSLACSPHSADKATLTMDGEPEKSRLLPNPQLEFVIDTLSIAIESGKLAAENEVGFPIDADFNTAHDISKTTIAVDELKRWLLSRNCKPPFFFADETPSTPAYLDPEHRHFAPQLAAAVAAWEAAQDDGLRSGKSVKRTVSEWLEANYRRLGLVHGEERNNSAIERIATLINWEPGGGAPKTPG